jgi:hypothetical protein
MGENGWRPARNYEQPSVVLRTFADGRRVIFSREASRMKAGCSCYKLLVGAQLYFAAEFVDATLDRELTLDLTAWFRAWALTLPEATD